MSIKYSILIILIFLIYKTNSKIDKSFLKLSKFVCDIVEDVIKTENITTIAILSDTSSDS